MVNDLLGRLPLAVRAHVEAEAGTLGFPEFCALIDAADLTITNNTGPMHMSAALGHTGYRALRAHQPARAVGAMARPAPPALPRSSLPALLQPHLPRRP
jgi:hypothetical protein